MHLIPVLGGHYRHIANGEILVQPVECCTCTSPSAGNNACAKLSRHSPTAGVEKSVHEGAKLSRCGGIIHGRTDDERRYGIKLIYHAVHGVIMHAAALLPAKAAVYAVGDRSIAKP